MLESLLEYKQPAQIAVGSVLFAYSLGCALAKLKRNVPVFRNYSKFVNQMQKNTFNIERYVKNPGLKENVVIPNMFFKPDLLQFQRHMKLIHDDKKEANEHHSYPEAMGNSFEAYYLEKGKKHKLWCNTEHQYVFMSASLLCNIQYNFKNHLKTDVTMCGYGEFWYDKSEKVFLFQGQSYAATQQQIHQAWQSILGLRLTIYLFIMGLGIGLGSSLLAHNKQKIQELASEGWRWVNQQIQPQK